MNYKFVILITLTFARFGHTVNLYSDNIPVIILKDAPEYNLNERVCIYKDTTGRATIYNVQSNDFKYFKRNNQNNIYFPFSYNTYWIKFRVKSKHSHINNYFLEIKNSTVNKLQLYYKYQNILVSSQETGDSHPFRTRQIQNRNFVFSLDLIPDKIYTFYIKVNGEGDALNLPICLYSSKGFVNKVVREYTFYSMFYGILITMLITTILMVFINLRFKVHFYYIAYIFIIGFWNFNLDGLGFQFLYPGLPWLTNRLVFVLPLLGFISLAVFTSDFFEIKKHRPRLYFYFVTINILTALITLLSIFDIFNLWHTFIILLVVGSIILLSISISAIIFYRKAPTLSVYYLLSFLVLIICTVIFSSNVITGAFGSMFRDNALKFGFIFQAIILFIGLTFRTKLHQNLLHKEAIQHLKEINWLKEKANINLEQKVLERTDEIEKRNAQLKTAYDEISCINIELEQQKEELSAVRDKIEEQNVILEKRNKDITDSINYAKQIQKSIFPSNEHFKKLLHDSFILLMHKEILSGAFYFIEEINHVASQSATQGNVANQGAIPSNAASQGTTLSRTLTNNMSASHTVTNREIILAVVDCTGHGVPGALMSLIARNLLYHIIKELNIIQPVEILRELNDGIFKTLGRTSSHLTGKEGMDIGIAKIDFNNMRLQFSGAKNSLYMFKNEKLHIYRGSGFSIGSFYNIDKIEVIEHNIELQKGDVLYMFTDGYTSQRGGADRKKFKFNQFRELLNELHGKPMIYQRQILENTFEKWISFKDNTGAVQAFEQIDDILIIGIRI
ncbi:MAG: SpoIIE family protein phosphatase [Bacteroidia bacterium]|nr:SpoIIE family protein phosphatase [Bacteroidia bacterium]